MSDSARKKAEEALKQYRELRELFDESGRAVRGRDVKWSLAPNGKESHLDDRRYREVRTPQFKAWAGDWELAKLHSIAKAAWNDKYVKERFDFVPSQRVLNRMRELLGLDVQRLVVTSDAIRHIKKHHGEDASRGQISMTPSDIALLPYLINNYDSMELSPEYNDKMGNRAIEIQKRINGLTIIATIERGNNEHVVTAWQFKKSNALDAPDGTPGLHVRNDFDAAKVQQEIDTIKKNLDNSTKVVDENGEPLVVYRGGEKIYIFEPDKASRMAMYGPAFYTTPSYADAQGFARERTGNEGNVQAVYLDIRNPWVDGPCDSLDYPKEATMEQARELVKLLAEKGLVDGNIILAKWNDGRVRSLLGTLADAKYEGRERGRGEFWHASDIVQDALKELGYDGVIGRFDSGDGMVDQIVAFRPEQIKSATENNGEFSRENPDVRFSLSEELENYQPRGSQLEQNQLNALFRMAQENKDAVDRRKAAMAEANRQLTELNDMFEGVTKDWGYHSGMAAARRGIATAQREYDKWTVDKLVGLAKEMLKSGLYKDIDPYKVQRLVGLINKAAAQAAVENA